MLLCFCRQARLFFKKGHSCTDWLVCPALIGIHKNAGMHAHAFRQILRLSLRLQTTRDGIVRSHRLPKTIQSGGIQNIDIKRCGSQPSGKGPAEYFTGTVRIDPLFEAPDPARVRGASITFEPGARTAWHTHQASPDLDRDGWLRPGTALGRPDRGNSTGRRDLVRAW
jgi:hypothetical protein